MFMLRLLGALIVTYAALGCSRFVWKEDPFTPDPAPVTEIIAQGRDTTYVLRGASYYLLSSQRDALWNREVVDDVAWRYRALFGDAPPTIAVRLAAIATTTTADTTWRGVPLATVATRARRGDGGGDGGGDANLERAGPPQDAGDSVRVRSLTRALLGATAAEAWLAARTAATARESDSQPGGAERSPLSGGSLPAWMEAGALRIIGSAGAAGRAAAELRANQKGIVPLASLFAVTWQRKPNAINIVRPEAAWPDGGAAPVVLDGPERARARGRRETIPDVPPLFIAQSASLLHFMHGRDPALVARLADELSRGASVASVLSSSATLPHDVSALEAGWKKWLQRSARRR